MSKSLNLVVLCGTIGRDAETKFTQGGKSITSFSIATDRSWKNASGEWQSEADWHNVKLWSGEKLAEYLLKGTKVTVNGRIQYGKYTNKDGAEVKTVDIVADNVVLMGGAKQGGGEGKSHNTGSENASKVQQSAQPDNFGAGDDDIPF